MEHTLPANHDAERAVLGAMMLDEHAILQAGSMGLKPEHFVLDAHRRVFGAITSLQSSGTAVDLITVNNELGRRKEVEAVGGVAYLSSLTDGVPPRSNIEHHVSIIREKASQRSLILACQTAIACAVENTENAAFVLSGLEADLLRIREADAPTTNAHVSGFTREYWTDLLTRRERKGDIIGLPIGVLSVDRATGGIIPGDFTVIGARPGVGKTSLAVQSTCENCRQGHPVQWFSLEMKRKQLLNRIAVMESYVPAGLVKFASKLEQDHLNKIEETLGDVHRWPLWVDDSSGLMIDDLVARAVLAVKKHRVELIVVDHTNKIQAKGKSIEERHTNIAVALSRLAKDYAPVIALSQLARPEGHNIRMRPNMTELRGSGMYEAEAHTILLLHRGRDNQNQFTGEDEVIIEKQREGITGIKPVRFSPEFLRYDVREVSR